jgi:glycosyltransferase involved in cell wall biosynthesis
MIMTDKPELIVVSQNLMGGGASFHRNMIENRPHDFFDIKIIYLDPLKWVAKRHENLTLGKDDVIFQFNDENDSEIAFRLNQHISSREGAILTNIKEELICLEYFPKKNKTVFFICHDEAFLYLAKRYSYLIDVFIAHNFAVYTELIRLLASRKKDIYFIQHGVNIQNFTKSVNTDKHLNVVFLARHVKLKGIYDLPKIDELLRKKSILVNWTVMGDGEEHSAFVRLVDKLENFHFVKPVDFEGVVEILKKQDVYILPSSLDGLPVSMLEAMSVGCVPIVYNFSDGIKRVVTPEIGFVVDIHDFSSMAENISKLNNDRNMLAQLSQNCVRKVESEFNITKQAAAYFALYSNFKKLRKKRFAFVQKVNKMVRNSYYLNRLFHRILPQ